MKRKIIISLLILLSIHVKSQYYEYIVGDTILFNLHGDTTGLLSVQWQDSSGGVWKDIVGATMPDYMFVASKTVYLRMKTLRQNCNPVYTAVQRIIVKEPEVKTCNCNGTVLYVYPKDTILSWAPYGFYFDTTHATSLTDGRANTDSIVKKHDGKGPYGAKYCYDLVAYGFDDWYLPAIDELHCLMKNSKQIGNFNDLIGYYSSTEINYEYVWGDSTSLAKGAGGKGYGGVRCVRRDGK